MKPDLHRYPTPRLNLSCRRRPRRGSTTPWTSPSASSEPGHVHFLCCQNIQGERERERVWWPFHDAMDSKVLGGLSADGESIYDLPTARRSWWWSYRLLRVWVGNRMEGRGSLGTKVSEFSRPIFVRHRGQWRSLWANRVGGWRVGNWECG